MVSFAGLFEVTALDVVLIFLFIYVVYKLFFKKVDVIELPKEKPIPPLKKQDMTVEQLRKYNGVDDEHICLAVCGKIFDVTRGKDFYGPEGPYGPLAGHDATRALANMDVKLVKDEWDDTTDLTEADMDEARGWNERFCMKYPVLGRLLAPGEEPAHYDTETEN